jgi:CARDB protein
MPVCLLICALLCAIVLSAPGGAGAAMAGDGPERADARARLISCRGGLDPLGRSLTVDSVMRSLRAGDRMHMRFELYQRAPGMRGFRRLTGPGLGTWNAATPGVQRFRFRKPIENLPAPAAYYVRVRYRWKDEAGQVFAAAARSTPLCRQPDLRADLRVVSVGAPRPLGANLWIYPVVVRNAGRGPSGEFDAVATVGDAPQPARTIRGLAPRERRTVELPGRRCPAGTLASVQLDPDNRVDESDERNNVRSFTCP